MSGKRTAWHVRTGEPAAAAVVDGWLRRHQLDVHESADAFAACLRLLGHDTPEPDIVFLGLDWLDADERLILSYIRETWPNVAVVAYVGDVRTSVPECGPRVCVCRSVAALRTLLAEPPEEVIRQVRPIGAEGPGSATGTENPRREALTRKGATTPSVPCQD